jgi:hypothetical protein
MFHAQPINIMDFLDNLDPLLRTFWYVAIPASVIFLIQTVLTFLGMDATDGLEADFDGDFNGGDAPFQVFSFRNLINFLLGFGWTGISFHEIFPNPTELILLATLVGASFVYLFFLIMNQVQKLGEDNSFKINETIGKTAEVYLAIPENRKGKGKVLVSVRGSTRELEAITNGERLASNQIVKISGIENNNLLIVE